MNGVDRPLDLLTQLKGKNIIVTLQNGKEVKAVLYAFDIHINLALEIEGKPKFIRGDNVESIDPGEEE